MAEITNPTAVKFANERCRVIANRLAQAYNFARSVRDEWYANNMGTLFTTGEGPIVDGSATDGRHVISADNVLLLIGRCEELVADYEANGKAKLNTILAVATRPAVGVGVEDR